MNDKEICERLAALIPEFVQIHEVQGIKTYSWKDTDKEVTLREFLFAVHLAEAKFCKDKDFWNCHSTWQERAVSLFGELEKREKAKTV